MTVLFTSFLDYLKDCKVELREFFASLVLTPVIVIASNSNPLLLCAAALASLPLVILLLKFLVAIWPTGK